MTTNYSELQLDALREAANIGAGNAATALSNLLGRPIGVSVPNAKALALVDAVDELGDPESFVTSVVIGVHGNLDALVLLVFTPEEAVALCELLGVDADTEWGVSALGEVGNILGCSYITALSALTGMSIMPSPPETVSDMLGAIVSSALVAGLEASDVAIILDSKLDVGGTESSFGFLFVPAVRGVAQLLDRLGVG